MYHSFSLLKIFDNIQQHSIIFVNIICIKNIHDYNQEYGYNAFNRESAPLIRNMITVQIWLDYQPFTSLISLNYHSFIGNKWNISKIRLKYKGGGCRFSNKRSFIQNYSLYNGMPKGWLFLQLSFIGHFPKCGETIYVHRMIQIIPVILNSLCNHYHWVTASEELGSGIKHAHKKTSRLKTSFPYFTLCRLCTTDVSKHSELSNWKAVMSLKWNNGRKSPGKCHAYSCTSVVILNIFWSNYSEQIKSHCLSIPLQQVSFWVTREQQGNFE